MFVPAQHGARAPNRPNGWNWTTTLLFDVKIEDCKIRWIMDGLKWKGSERILYLKFEILWNWGKILDFWALIYMKLLPKNGISKENVNV